MPKPHVNTSLGGIISANSFYNTGGAYFPVPLPQVAISGKDILPVASLSKRSGTIVLLVISDVSPVTYCKLEDIWIKA